MAGASHTTLNHRSAGHFLSPEFSHMSTAEIQFVNKSMSTAPVDVVFFEPARFFDSQTMRNPFLFIQQCPYDFTHPFLFENSLQLGLRDQYGNYTPQVTVKDGSRYSIRLISGKVQLVQEANEHAADVEIFNELPQGSPDIILRRGRVITAWRSGLAPGEFYSFRLPDEFYARKISGIQQARRLVQLEMDGYSTLIRLNGVANAELLLTGGGTGVQAQKYVFTLYDKTRYE